MAITQSLLTSGSSTTDAQTYDTASITPTADKPVIMGVVSRIAAGTENNSTVTVDGCSLTWDTPITTRYGAASGTGAAKRVTVIRGIGASPTTGVITITITGTGNLRCCWGVVQLDGDIDSTDTIVQSAVNQTTGASAPFTLTVTLAALGDATNNAVLAFFGNDDDASTFTEGADYTELFDVAPGTEDARLCAIWKNPGTTTPNVSNSVSFTDVGGIAVELRYAAAGVTTRRYSLSLTGTG